MKLFATTAAMIVASASLSLAAVNPAGAIKTKVTTLTAIAMIDEANPILGVWGLALALQKPMSQNTNSDDGLVLADNDDREGRWFLRMLNSGGRDDDDDDDDDDDENDGDDDRDDDDDDGDD